MAYHDGEHHDVYHVSYGSLPHAVAWPRIQCII